MSKPSTKRIAVPIVVGLALVGVFALVLVLRDGGQGQSRDEAPPPPPATASELWRCNACARVRGKNWQTCKSVTGRGTEAAARDLMKQRVCEEASDPALQCTIINLSCRRNDAGGSGRPPRDGGAGSLDASR